MGKPAPGGGYLVDVLLANVCKQNVTRFPFEIARLAQDIAGGMVVTMPSEHDFENAEIAPYLEKYFKGDASVPAISAASILAKVARDAEMLALDAAWPGYGFAVHKGYPTRLHLEALARLGPTAVHRRSFGPVRRLLDAEGPPVRSGR